MVISAIIPIALIVIIGIIARRKLNLEYQSLARLTIYIFAPALVADNLYHTDLSEQSIGGILLGFSLVSLVLYGVSWSFCRLVNSPPIIAKSFITTTLLPNNGNLGLPLIDFTLGAGGLERAVIYLIGSSLLLFGIIPALLNGKGFVNGLNLTLRLPLIWAMIAGICLRSLHIELPNNIANALRQLGQAAIPVALIILGMQLANSRFTIGRYECVAAVGRLVLAPLTALVVGRLLQLKGLDLQVLVLQSAMPVAVSSIVLVTEFGGDGARVARTVTATTFMSLVTLPLVVWLLAKL